MRSLRPIALIIYFWIHTDNRNTPKWKIIQNIYTLGFKSWESATCTKSSSLIIKQKDKSQNGGSKKTKHAKFSQKTNMHTYICVSEGKKCFFSGNLECFVFLVPSFWDAPFCLITNELHSAFTLTLLLWLSSYFCWCYHKWFMKSCFQHWSYRK